MQLNKRKTSSKAVGILLIVTGLLTIVMLVAALDAMNRSSRIYFDLSKGGTLRYRMMWIYGATSTVFPKSEPAPDWRGQLSQMAQIRAYLLTHYNVQVRPTDRAWEVFSSSLSKTGHVTWSQSDTLRASLNTMTHSIVLIARRENTLAERFLWCGVFAALLFLTGAGMIFLKLRAVDRWVREPLVDRLHERTLALEQLTTSQNLFRSVIDTMQEGLVVQDLFGAIEIVNPAAERILGVTAEQMQGISPFEPTWRIVSEDFVDIPRSQRPAYLTLHDGQARHSTVMGVYRAEKDLRWIQTSSVPLFRANGTESPHAGDYLTGVVSTFTDITEQYLFAQEVSRLAAIIEFSKDAVLGAALDGTLASWNHAAENLYGYTAAEMIGSNACLLTPPEERNFFPAIVEAVQRGESREGIEVVRTRKDGSKIDLSLSFSPIRGKTGVLIGIACIGRDITEKKASEERIRVSESRLAEAQKVGKVGSFEYDLVTEQILWSDEVFRLYEFDKDSGSPSIEQLLGRYDPVDLPKRNLRFKNSIATGEPFDMDIKLELPSGVKRHCHLRAQPIYDETGSPVRMVGTVMDITERLEAQQVIEAYNAALEYQMAELSLANEKLATLSTTDGLTELANHRKFQERLSDEFVKSKRYFKPLSLIVLDVDQFKQFNDSFGHPEGDAVLKKLAKLMKQVARDADLPARYGGEEFAIILPETTSAGAEALAERLRKSVEEAAWDCRSVTISIGVATVTPAVADQAELVRQADTALYRAKDTGRNRVFCA